MEWVKLRKGLFVFCRRYHGLSVEDAEDISQQALCRVFDDKLPGWDEQRYPTMREWLGSIVNGLVANLRKNVGRKREKLLKEGKPDAEPGTDGEAVYAPPLPDEAAITAERASRAISRVLELVKGDTLAEAVVMLKVEDVDTARDQAEALKVDVAKVYRAREKVAAAAAQALKEED